jgi:hypothetical protein
MKDYAMMFERLVLATWGKQWPREDPFGLGSAEVWAAVNDDNINSKEGEAVKMAIGESIKKVIIVNEANEGVTYILKGLYNQLMGKINYNELRQILEKTTETFESTGMIII